MMRFPGSEPEKVSFLQKADRGLEGGENDKDDENAEQEAAAVGDGIDYGVFVEVAAGGLEPEAHDPEKKDGNEKPKASGVLIELGGVEGGDVEGEDHDRGKAAGGAEAAKLLDVGDVVAASACGGPAALSQVFQLGEAFDQGEARERRRC